MRQEWYCLDYLWKASLSISLETQILLLIPGRWRDKVREIQAVREEDKTQQMGDDRMKAKGENREMKFADTPASLK